MVALDTQRDAAEAAEGRWVASQTQLKDQAAAHAKAAEDTREMHATVNIREKELEMVLRDKTALKDQVAALQGQVAALQEQAEEVASRGGVMQHAASPGMGGGGGGGPHATFSDANLMAEEMADLRATLEVERAEAKRAAKALEAQETLLRQAEDRAAEAERRAENLKASHQSGRAEITKLRREAEEHDRNANADEEEVAELRADRSRLGQALAEQMKRAEAFESRNVHLEEQLEAARAQTTEALAEATEAKERAAAAGAGAGNGVGGNSEQLQQLLVTESDLTAALSKAREETARAEAEAATHRNDLEFANAERQRLQGALDRDVAELRERLTGGGGGSGGGGGAYRHFIPNIFFTENLLPHLIFNAFYNQSRFSMRRFM